MPDTPNPNPGGHQQVPEDRIDPNVVMPPHVVAATQRSADAFKTAYGGENGQVVEGTAPEGVKPPNGAAVAPAAPNANGHAPAPVPVESELPETNPDGTPNWENRFKSLKGRYDATERRTRETLEQYDQRMREMSGQLAQATRQPLPGENMDQPPTLITPKEVEDYGADLIDVIKRAATEAVMPMLKPIATTVGQMQARVETTENETGRQFLTRMHTTMDTRVPGWQDINREQRFIDWVKRPDVYSGLNRQELLQKAWYAGDSNRVAAFFEGYLAEEAAVDPAAAQARVMAQGGQGGHAQPASPAQPPTPARVTLEQLAAPGRARAGAVAPAGKPVWTAEGISQFYMDVARGVFRGRDAERVATEADLMAAQREGRIVINPRTATTITGS